MLELDSAVFSYADFNRITGLVFNNCDSVCVGLMPDTEHFYVDGIIGVPVSIGLMNNDQDPRPSFVLAGIPCECICFQWRIPFEQLRQLWATRNELAPITPTFVLKFCYEVGSTHSFNTETKEFVCPVCAEYQEKIKIFSVEESRPCFSCFDDIDDNYLGITKEMLRNHY